MDGRANPLMDRKGVEALMSLFFIIYLSIYLSIHPPTHLSIFLCIYLSVCLSVYLFACVFWLRNVLRATKAPSFSTSQLPKCSDVEVFCPFLDFNTCFVRQRRAIFHLSSPQMSFPACRFSEDTSPEPQNIGQTVLRDISTCLPTLVFFLLTLLFWLFLCCFYLFSDCSHPCSCICPQVENLTSKLPSVICRYTQVYLSHIFTVYVMCSLCSHAPIAAVHVIICYISEHEWHVYIMYIYILSR